MVEIDALGEAGVGDMDAGGACLDGEPALLEGEGESSSLRGHLLGVGVCAEVGGVEVVVVAQRAALANSAQQRSVHQERVVADDLVHRLIDLAVQLRDGLLPRGIQVLRQ